MDPDPGIMEPVFQYGFAGFAMVLFGALLWLVKVVLAAQKGSDQVIANNTAALNSLITSSDEARNESRKVHDQLLSRPCLLPRDERGRNA